MKIVTSSGLLVLLLVLARTLVFSFALKRVTGTNERALSSSSLSSQETTTPNIQLSFADREQVPWQSSSPTSLQTVLEASRYEELSPIIFSPSGRLHKVEAAVKASKSSTNLRSNTVIALQCREGLVVITTLPTSAFLNTSEEVVAMVDGSNGNVSNTIKNNHTTTDVAIATQSLFLFDETCSTTTTSPIMNLLYSSNGGVVAVAATGGNAVDGKVLRKKLLALAAQQQQQADDDRSLTTATQSLSKDMADLMQIATQDMVASSDKIPLLASTAVVLGNQEIWRIDPTGQFWKCNGAVVGQDSDHVEEALYQLLMQKISQRGHRQFHDDGDDDNGTRIQQYLISLSSTEALEIAKECLEAHITKRQPRARLATFQSSASTTIAMPPIYWHAVILHYVEDDDGRIISSGATKQPRKTVKRGAFVSRQDANQHP